MENKIKLTENFFKNVIETSHDEIFVCDKNGVTIYCNKSFESNYGINREDMIGKTAMDLIKNGYSDQSPIEEVIKTKEPFSLPQTTGIGRKLIITATPFFDDDGEIEFIVENCRDITELEKIKEKLFFKEKEIEIYKSNMGDKIFARDINYFDGFISSEIKKVFNIAKKVSKTDATILIEGESGTGKTHIAKMIHEHSNRSGKPFININCSTIPSSLFESEIFGYVSGAFTGAKTKGKIGYVEMAEGGTLFLDEIGEIPLMLQAKLLGLIQEKKYIAVGGIKEKTADIRIIAATNLSLEDLVKEKAFRKDLYYRLNVVNIKMPSLRERVEDIRIISEYFLEKYNKEYGVRKRISNEVYKIFEKYSWPGNIRELENLIQNLVIMTSLEQIIISNLPPIMLLENKKMEELKSVDFNNLVCEYEKAIVKKYYKVSKSSYKMAKELNISQSKAMRLIKKYIK